MMLASSIMAIRLAHADDMGGMDMSGHDMSHMSDGAASDPSNMKEGEMEAM
jgi:hypothetical protein